MPNEKQEVGELGRLLVEYAQAKQLLENGRIDYVGAKCNYEIAKANLGKKLVEMWERGELNIAL